MSTHPLLHDLRILNLAQSDNLKIMLLNIGPTLSGIFMRQYVKIGVSNLTRNYGKLCSKA
jgi:hypothetical protein